MTDTLREPGELIDEAIAHANQHPKAEKPTDFAWDADRRTLAVVKGLAAIASALMIGLGEIAEAIRDK